MRTPGFGDVFRDIEDDIGLLDPRPRLHRLQPCAPWGDHGRQTAIAAVKLIISPPCSFRSATEPYGPTSEYFPFLNS